MRPIELIQRLQLVDRRAVYAVVLLVLGIPFLVRFNLPIYPDRYSRRTFELVERVITDPAQRNKVVLVLSNWGPGSEGENGPQVQVLLQHLLRRRMPFILCSTGLEAVNIAVAEARLDKAFAAERQRALQRGEAAPAWVYGRDWLNLGYNPSPVFEPIAKTLVLNTREFYQRDFIERKPLTDANFPILRNLHGVDDVALVVVISAGDEARTICGIVQRQVPGLKVVCATMGIVANDLYPYVKSGQLSGLLNSARAAAEYLSLLDPEAPLTGPIENSMTLGKMLLLALVLLGNVAYLLTRRAERAGTLTPRAVQGRPMPALPKPLLRGLFVGFVVLYGGALAVELVRDVGSGGLPRRRAMQPGEIAVRDTRPVERVGFDVLRGEQQLDGAGADAARFERRGATRARAEFARLIESRAGEFVAALLTLGIFAFLLGDNRLYRFTEAFMIGGALAFLLFEMCEKVLWPKWLALIFAALAPDGNPWQLAWVLVLIPGSLWYFVYSSKYRWLNQIVVALFLALAIGPKFGEQIGLLVPQVVDSIRPVWPWVSDDVTGALRFDSTRVEQLVFVVVLVLSLTYFVFCLRPRTRLGRGVIGAGRLVMMLGFGAMFGNTVNTRLSWLAPRVGFLLEDWLGKLFGS